MPNDVMSGEYVADERVDIYKYPDLDEAHLAKDGSEITLGDLHANAVKLLYALLRHGFIKMEKNDYKEFVALYEKSVKISEHMKNLENYNRLQAFEAWEAKGSPKESRPRGSKPFLPEGFDPKQLPFTEEDLEKTNAIIDRVAFNKESKGSLLRLIGDELSDRGASDYFILKILDKLKGNVPVEVMMSNHSAEFLKEQESKAKFTDALGGGQSASSLGLQYLIDKKWVKRNDVDKMVSQAYKPYLKAIGYSLDADGKKITIHTHAAIDVATIKEISEKLGVQYEGENAKLLAKTIDRINEELQKQYIKKGTLSDLIKGKDGMIHESDVLTNPFVRLVWNRSYHGEKKYYQEDLTEGTVKLNRGSDFISFSHGHDPNDPDICDGNVINVDNNLGKYNEKSGEHNNVGFYDVVYSDKTSPSVDIKIDADSLDKLIGSLKDFFERVKKLADDPNNEYVHIGKQEVMNDFLVKLNELSSDTTMESVDKLDKLRGLLTNLLQQKACSFNYPVEKVMKSYLERVARGEKINTIEFRLHAGELEDKKEQTEEVSLSDYMLDSFSDQKYNYEAYPSPSTLKGEATRLIKNLCDYPNIDKAMSVLENRLNKLKEGEKIDYDVPKAFLEDLQKYMQENKAQLEHKFNWNKEEPKQKDEKKHSIKTFLQTIKGKIKNRIEKRKETRKAYKEERKAVNDVIEARLKALENIDKKISEASTVSELKELKEQCNLNKEILVNLQDTKTYKKSDSVFWSIAGAIHGVETINESINKKINTLVKAKEEKQGVVSPPPSTIVSPQEEMSLRSNYVLENFSSLVTQQQYEKYAEDLETSVGIVQDEEKRLIKDLCAYPDIDKAMSVLETRLNKLNQNENIDYKLPQALLEGLKKYMEANKATLEQKFNWDKKGPKKEDGKRRAWLNAFNKHKPLDDQKQGASPSSKVVENIKRRFTK